ncbi:MAG: hypothetical protein KDK33_20220, partial [Leptospiraceae bacterium]|nr:hypothetical protein [Leptospiraceae bacterium]
LAIKPDRTAQEYCWTVTPSLIRYCLNKFEPDACTYLDADMYFFQSPEDLLSLLPENRHVMITPHNYAPQYDLSATSGKYCVQFMVFRNTQEGREVLEWWRDACIEWCYARFEDGKFGDQKYLDDWLQRFPEVVFELDHHGAGVAPWNVIQYKILGKSGRLCVRHNGRDYPAVFYHFHGLRIGPDRLYFNEYRLQSKAIESFYRPYMEELQQISKDYSPALGNADLHGMRDVPADSGRTMGAFLTDYLRSNAGSLLHLMQAFIGIQAWRRWQTRNTFPSTAFVRSRESANG